MSADDRAAYRQAEAALWATVGRSPSEQWVRLPTTGTTVRVQEVGVGDPVLFLHGGPNAGAGWVPMVEHLRGFRCLLLDRPGTGLSAAYPITAGNLALRSAAADPGRIRRMVQASCPASAPGERAPPFMRALTKGWIRKVANALPPDERASRWILRQLGHGASLDAGQVPQALFDWYLALQRHTDTMRNDGGLIGRLVPNRAAITLSDDLLGDVTVPTLFWRGAADTFGGEQLAGHLVDAMPMAERTLVPDAGHLPWLDDPRDAAVATMTFLGAEVASR